MNTKNWTQIFLDTGYQLHLMQLQKPYNAEKIKECSNLLEKIFDDIGRDNKLLTKVADAYDMLGKKYKIHEADFLLIEMMSTMRLIEKAAHGLRPNEKDFPCLMMFCGTLAMEFGHK